MVATTVPQREMVFRSLWFPALCFDVIPELAFRLLCFPSKATAMLNISISLPLDGLSSKFHRLLENASVSFKMFAPQRSLLVSESLRGPDRRDARMGLARV